jgi:hypothetical protein
MLNTKQVRAIIAQHSTSTYGVYTNKTTGDMSNRRRVKCYFRNNMKLFFALQKAAGFENVRLTEGGAYAGGRPGIVVKCVLADENAAPF